MNTETPPTHDELVEKLEKAASYLENQTSPDSVCSPRGVASLLRATIAGLKRGQEDTRRLDKLDRVSFWGLSPRHDIRVQKRFIRSETWRFKDYDSVRDAIDSIEDVPATISSTAKEEA